MITCDRCGRGYRRALGIVVSSRSEEETELYFCSSECAEKYRDHLKRILATDLDQEHARDEELLRKVFGE